MTIKQLQPCGCTGGCLVRPDEDLEKHFQELAQRGFYCQKERIIRQMKLQIEKEERKITSPNLHNGHSASCLCCRHFCILDNIREPFIVCDTAYFEFYIYELTRDSFNEIHDACQGCADFIAAENDNCELFQEETE